jgi:acyl dehydratase
MTSTTPKYFGDLRLGDLFHVGRLSVEREQMLQYARTFDAQPIHVDEAAARAAGFKSVIASGWFTMSIAMKLMVERDPFSGTRILGIGADRVRWPHPTYAGDTVTGQIAVQELQPPRDGRNWGFVRLKYVLLNQVEQLVLELQPLLAVPVVGAAAQGN